MKKYRIVASPRMSGKDEYYIQWKGCGPFSFFWHTQKKYLLFDSYFNSYTAYFPSAKSAKEYINDLRKYDSSKERVVHETGCCDGKSYDKN